MKQLPKHARAGKAGGGGHERLGLADAKGRQRPQKNCSRKREPHDGILAVQFDPEGRLFEGSGRVARDTRERVQSLLTTNVARLLRLALQEEDGLAKKWAGDVLANIVSRIGVEDRNLRERNKSYRDWRSKIGKKLGTVLHPRAIISLVVQCELAVAERVRDLFKVYGFTGVSDEKAKRLIRECYWPVKDLLEFSIKSEPEWWKFLWPSIKKNYPGLLMALKKESIADEKRWSTFRQRFRQHLQLLARRRGQGIETR